MRLLFWVTALAVLTAVCAKNSTTKTKPKRQLDSIRSPQNLQYSLVLPHSRVAHFRSLNNNNRRISHGTPKGGKLPPYAVQMEPVVQYSQKDPLYDRNLENLDDSVVSKNEIYAQSKILNTQEAYDNFGPPYGSLPTAPLYSQEPHPHYYEAPEPIIEIIIKESNETLPAPPPPPVQKKKKEPVHVFYVKYSKDPNSKDKVIYEKPIPAITPPTNDEDEHEHDHHEEYITVTPEPYIPVKTTTLRAIIKPESEVYHSDSSVRVTFGSEGHHSHYSDRREGQNHSEDHEETAPRPAIAIPNQPPANHASIERSASPKPQYSHETETKSTILHPNHQYRSNGQHAQSRIQFQPQSFPTDQQLPRQGPTTVPFRAQSHVPRHPFASPSSLIPNPAFANGPPGIITYNSPTAPTPLGPVFPTNFPRPNNGPSFVSRPNSPPQFGARTQFNGPPRTSFHSGPQRPFHPPQSPSKQPYFDEPKYLQENYHTITTEQVDPPKEQILPSRQTPTFNRLPVPQASPSPTPVQFQDHFHRPQNIHFSQQLPQQRPTQSFSESHPQLPISPSPSPFFNLKPSPPHIESHRVPFQPPSQQFSFHQGPTALPSPTAIPPQHQNQHSLSRPSKPSPSPVPQHQFLPQPSSSPIYSFQPQPSPTPDHPGFFHQPSPSERPQFQQPHGPSDRPPFYQVQGSSERPPFSHQSNFKTQTNVNHQQNVGPFVPNGGELIAAIPKYEQHITVNGPAAQPHYSGFSESSQPSPSPSHNVQQFQHQQQQQNIHQQYQQQQEQQFQRQQHQEQQRQQQQQQQHQQHQQQQHQQQQQQQQHQHQQQQHQHQQQQLHQQQQQQQHQQQLHQQHQQHQLEQQHQQEQQQHLQQYDAEQEQVRQQLAENVKKQQEEIQRLQTQLLYTQQQQDQQHHDVKQYHQQIQATSPRSQYIQERSRAQSSTASPAYYQSTSRTVEIKPTTHKYVSSTVQSISTPAPEKKEKKKPTFELPDEVPDDLRQQLLSSGILENADISVLDYDKVGDTPLESLPPDQLANFYGAGGGQQIASSENRPVYIKPNGEKVESRMIDEMEDQELAASENVPSYAPPPSKQAVDMKVVHFDPNTEEGQNIASKYVNENATQVEPVALNDKKYNRYLPLKVSGNQFPLPDILKGRKVTSVVVLAPVETETLKEEHSRQERSAASTASNNLKGIKFVAGDSLQDLLRKPTKDNFQRWLEVENKTSSDHQSIVLLVTGDEKPEEEKEIFMYDIASGSVNKLSGELSNAFVEAAENNSLSKDIETLAIEGEGTPEDFNNDDTVADGSENVPLFVDLPGVSLDAENSNHVSITSGYSKTKLGRSLRRN